MVTIEASTIIRAPIERCFDLARRVEVRLAVWRAKHFRVWYTLTSEITITSFELCRETKLK